MEYLSALETAKKWRLHVRTVQAYCSQGRIPNVKKISRLWLIPAGAQKPEDPRCHPSKALPNPSNLWQSTRIFVLDSGRADESIQTMEDPDEGLLYGAYLAYLRGDFASPSQCHRHIAPDSLHYPSALLISSLASISRGDMDAFANREVEFIHLIEKLDAATPLYRYVVFMQQILDVSLYANFHLPEWLKTGDFSELPPSLRLLAFQQYVKYLHDQGDFEKMQLVADTLLSLYHTENQYTIYEIYLLLHSALGHLVKGQLENAEKRVNRALDLAMPDRIIMPFSENITTLRGLIEKCMKKKYPQMLEPVLAKWKSIFPHWVKLHNAHVKEDITLLLTRREYQIALYAVDKLTNKEIAQKSGVSPGTIKEQLKTIYQKLGISSRTQLKQYVL